MTEAWPTEKLPRILPALAKPKPRVTKTMKTTTTHSASKNPMLRLALVAGLAVTMSPLTSCGGMDRRDDRRDYRDDRRDTRQDTRDDRQDARRSNY
jgi:hypothetical protein